jgi:hypothetical protein
MLADCPILPQAEARRCTEEFFADPGGRPDWPSSFAQFLAHGRVCGTSEMPKLEGLFSTLQRSRGGRWELMNAN